VPSRKRPPAKEGAAAAEPAPRAKPRSRKKAAPATRPLPGPEGAAPLHELSRDALSVFLYVALVPEETKALVKELGLSVPGFRTDALGDVQRCDVLADEVRARPEVGARVLELLRKAFGRVALHTAALDEAAADDLLATAGTENGLPLALWRVLADPEAAVRTRAVPALEQLAREYYGPLPEGEGEGEAAPPGDGRDGEAAARARVQELERELERADQRAESARKKGEEQREKLQEWLKEARARAAQATDEAARAREAALAAAAARERAEAALAAVQTTDAAAEVQRARAAVRELEAKVAGLEARLARQQAREEELSLRLERAEERARSATVTAPVAAPGGEEPEADEAPDAAAAWLRPIYTREFYDSLEGWDLRIQRAAFKQANLLALDHRHPSLRALPLEGLPGYYRVRVATDVRLLYRRGEKQNEIEILSLIDREDLDRYVRQAKTR
jgi:hypothetical protein